MDDTDLMRGLARFFMSEWKEDAADCADVLRAIGIDDIDTFYAGASAVAGT